LLINRYVDRVLDDAFAALADPTRRAIVHRLASGEATVNELARPFPMSLQAVSRHLGVLKRCGLVEQRVDGKRRPCRLNPVALGELTDWIDEQRSIWDERLDALEDHLG
jgi:DNA-binding transcriptional ArsR family regulator